MQSLIFLCAYANLHEENEDPEKQGGLRAYILFKQRINCRDKIRQRGLGDSSKLWAGE